MKAVEEADQGLNNHCKHGTIHQVSKGLFQRPSCYIAITKLSIKVLLAPDKTILKRF
jgi:hypothetical protein